MTHIPLAHILSRFCNKNRLKFYCVRWLPLSYAWAATTQSLFTKNKWSVLQMTVRNGNTPTFISYCPLLGIYSTGKRLHS